MRPRVEPSSFGWDPSEKKKELFNANARYILILHQDATDDTEKGPQIVAFSHFRFEHEFDEDIIYW